MKQLFTALYFAGMVAEIIVRFPHERQRRQIPKTDRRVTLAERSLHTVESIGMGLLPGVYGLTSWLDFADYNWAPATQAIVGSMGTVFLGAAIWLFWRSHRDLGANWSPFLEIGDQQRLITHGVYRAIRHPMYASQLLYGVAQALLLHNWIAGCAGLVVFLLLYLVIVPREERMMLAHFGDEYRAYCEQTGRIVPRLNR